MTAAADTRRPRPRFILAASDAPGLTATGVICGALVVWGSLFRSDSDIVAEEGIGYALGIIGLAMMALLLTYSLRKRMPVLLARFSIQRWFEIHMMLGLMGPTAILFHCNFRLGSLNSNVALISMLLVTVSGIAGRFMYTRIHHGLLGDRATLAELHDDIFSRRSKLSKFEGHGEGAETALVAFEDHALGARTGIWSSIVRFASLGSRELATARTCRQASQGMAPVDRRAYRVAVHDHLMTVRRATEFSAYAWIFSLWHALHLPLCILLFTAAGIHILAVNLY